MQTRRYATNQHNGRLLLYKTTEKLLDRFFLLEWQVKKIYVALRGVIVGTREKGHSLSKIELKFRLRARLFYECVVNIEYSIKHQILWPRKHLERTGPLMNDDSSKMR